MDISDLFLSCRKGDLGRVKHLVEQKEIDLNVRDKWDSTPLYYACLCGHEELVKYLLENEARCEANTFDGERCVYGALTNRIRNVLRNYKAVTSATMRRDLYTEFLRRLLERRDSHPDVQFVVHGERFPAHRCVLAARSEYLAALLRSTWRDRATIPVQRKTVQASTFRLMLQYLYTARIEVPVEQVEELMKLARHCRLQRLELSLAERLKHTASFECTKPGVKVTVISVEPTTNETTLQRDLGSLADEALPAQFCNQTDMELPFSPEGAQLFPDVIFSMEGCQFRCHKAFFAGRSEYFRVLLKDSFAESVHDDTDDMSVVTLHDVSAAIFVPIMYYIYQDSCELTAQTVHEVLCKADIYLLSGLKRLCAGVMARLLDAHNVVAVLRTARLFTLTKLEHCCTEFIAMHLDEMVRSEELCMLVHEDARMVHCRQATDSIPVIDDVRSHIEASRSDARDTEQRLRVIDDFLERLQLEA